MSKSQRDRYRSKLQAAVNAWAEGSRYAADFAEAAREQHPELYEAVFGLIAMVMESAELLDHIRAKL